MKLRIKGDSLRLRITPSEMRRLLSEGRIEETIHFAAEDAAYLTYALERSPVAREVSVQYRPGQVTVLVPASQACAWAEGDEVGVYGTLNLGAGQLEIAVEKDWACLDKSGDESRDDGQDTFPNPNQGRAC
jgi:hypothetical protein